MNPTSGGQPFDPDQLRAEQAQIQKDLESLQAQPKTGGLEGRQVRLRQDLTGQKRTDASYSKQIVKVAQDLKAYSQKVAQYEGEDKQSMLRFDTSGLDKAALQGRIDMTTLEAREAVNAINEVTNASTYAELESALAQLGSLGPDQREQAVQLGAQVIAQAQEIGVLTHDIIHQVLDAATGAYGEQGVEGFKEELMQQAQAKLEGDRMPSETADATIREAFTRYVPKEAASATDELGYYDALISEYYTSEGDVAPIAESEIQARGWTATADELKAQSETGRPVEQDKGDGEVQKTPRDASQYPPEPAGPVERDKGDGEVQRALKGRVKHLARKVAGTKTDVYNTASGEKPASVGDSMVVGQRREGGLPGLIRMAKKLVGFRKTNKALDAFKEQVHKPEGERADPWILHGMGARVLLDAQARGTLDMEYTEWVLQEMFGENGVHQDIGEFAGGVKAMMKECVECGHPEVATMILDQFIALIVPEVQDLDRGVSALPMIEAVQAITSNLLADISNMDSTVTQTVVEAVHQLNALLPPPAILRIYSQCQDREVTHAERRTFACETAAAFLKQSMTPNGQIDNGSVGLVFAALSEVNKENVGRIWEDVNRIRQILISDTTVNAESLTNPNGVLDDGMRGISKKLYKKKNDESLHQAAAKSVTSTVMGALQRIKGKIRAAKSPAGPGETDQKSKLLSEGLIALEGVLQARRARGLGIGVETALVLEVIVDAVSSGDLQTVASSVIVMRYLTANDQGQASGATPKEASMEVSQWCDNLEKWCFEQYLAAPMGLGAVEQGAYLQMMGRANAVLDGMVQKAEAQGSPVSEADQTALKEAMDVGCRAFASGDPQMVMAAHTRLEQIRARLQNDPGIGFQPFKDFNADLQSDSGVHAGLKAAVPGIQDLVQQLTQEGSSNIPDGIDEQVHDQISSMVAYIAEKAANGEQYAATSAMAQLRAVVQQAGIAADCVDLLSWCDQVAENGLSSGQVVWQTVKGEYSWEGRAVRGQAYHGATNFNCDALVATRWGAGVMDGTGFDQADKNPRFAAVANMVQHLLDGVLAGAEGKSQEQIIQEVHDKMSVAHNLMAVFSSGLTLSIPVQLPGISPPRFLIIQCGDSETVRVRADGVVEDLTYDLAGDEEFGGKGILQIRVVDMESGDLLFSFTDGLRDLLMARGETLEQVLRDGGCPPEDPVDVAQAHIAHVYAEIFGDLNTHIEDIKSESGDYGRIDEDRDVDGLKLGKRADWDESDWGKYTEVVSGEIDRNLKKRTRGWKEANALFAKQMQLLQKNPGMSVDDAWAVAVNERARIRAFEGKLPEPLPGVAENGEDFKWDKMDDIAMASQRVKAPAAAEPVPATGAARGAVIAANAQLRKKLDSVSNAMDLHMALMDWAATLPAGSAEQIEASKFASQAAKAGRTDKKGPEDAAQRRTYEAILADVRAVIGEAPAPPTAEQAAENAAYLEGLKAELLGEGSPTDAARAGPAEDEADDFARMLEEVMGGIRKAGVDAASENLRSMNTQFFNAMAEASTMDGLHAAIKEWIEQISEEIDEDLLKEAETLRDDALLYSSIAPEAMDGIRARADALVARIEGTQE